MNDWKKIQKLYKTKELMGLFFMIIFFLIGVICDWNVLVKKMF